jgi:sec-independent protein translocase protein TatB
MLPDIGFLELFIVFVVVLVVIGPAQMPDAARKVGKFVGKIKKMADNFMKSFNDIA